jgi:phosphoglycerate kinase
MLKVAKGLRSSDAKLELPVDVVVKRGTSTTTIAIGQVRPTDRIMDIGPDTVDVFSRAIATAKTVIWNGPMGVYEVAPFSKGTLQLAKRIRAAKPQMSVAGGGETVDAIHRGRAENAFTLLSTGGGAMLEFLEGKTLPGIRAVTQ